MKQDTLLKMVLGSDLSELGKVEEFVDQIVNASQADEELTGSIMLLLSEAATNGIIHGNKQIPGKEVILEARISDTQVIITITDEGDGFNPEEVPDPLAEQNLLKPSGRGLYLMREYADDVQYNEKGNQLKLTFKR
jgi:serine/threonine-protein kinase RsbW